MNFNEVLQFDISIEVVRLFPPGSMIHLSLQGLLGVELEVRSFELGTDCEAKRFVNPVTSLYVFMLYKLT